MQTLWQDLRFALRQVWKNPGFSLTAILSLALGIGATVSVFSVLYGAVIDPWPYAGFDRVGPRINYCSIQHTENRNRSSNSKCEGEDCRQGKTGVLPHLS